MHLPQMSLNSQIKLKKSIFKSFSSIMDAYIDIMNKYQMKYIKSNYIFSTKWLPPSMKRLDKITGRFA